MIRTEHSNLKADPAIPDRMHSACNCPECDAPVLVEGDMVIGRQIRCSNCASTLEIVDESPFMLDYAFVAPIEGYLTIQPD